MTFEIHGMARTLWHHIPGVIDTGVYSMRDFCYLHPLYGAKRSVATESTDLSAKSNNDMDPVVRQCRLRVGLTNPARMCNSPRETYRKKRCM